MEGTLSSCPQSLRDSTILFGEDDSADSELVYLLFGKYRDEPAELPSAQSTLHDLQSLKPEISRLDTCPECRAKRLGRFRKVQIGENDNKQVPTQRDHGSNIWALHDIEDPASRIILKEKVPRTFGEEWAVRDTVHEIVHCIIDVDSRSSNDVHQETLCGFGVRLSHSKKGCFTQAATRLEVADSAITDGSWNIA